MSRLLDDRGAVNILLGYLNSNNLPHNYVQGSVTYTGTHDSATLLEWYKGLSRVDRDFLRQYCRTSFNSPIDAIIKTVFQSVAKLVIVPIQDYLALGREARINVPSTICAGYMEAMMHLGEHSLRQNTIEFLHQFTYNGTG